MNLGVFRFNCFVFIFYFIVFSFFCFFFGFGVFVEKTSSISRILLLSKLITIAKCKSLKHVAFSLFFSISLSISISISLSVVLIYNYSANVLTHKLAKVPNFFGKEVDGCWRHADDEDQKVGQAQVGKQEAHPGPDALCSTDDNDDREVGDDSGDENQGIHDAGQDDDIPRGFRNGDLARDVHGGEIVDSGRQ